MVVFAFRMFSLMIWTADFGGKFLISSMFKFVKFTIPARKKGSGRPRKEAHSETSRIHLKTSCLELANIAERTISCVLQKQLNIPSRMAAMIPLLSAKMKKKRLQFSPKKNTRPGVLLTGPRSHTVMNQPFAALGPPGVRCEDPVAQTG